jgi:hypothetical protein
VLHRVSDYGDPAYSISPTTLDALLAWLQRREANGTIVRTICDVVGDEKRTTPSTARTAA